MNLLLVPKYTIYNKTLKRAYKPSTWPQTNLSSGTEPRLVVEDRKPSRPFPLTVEVSRPKSQKSRHVHIAEKRWKRQEYKTEPSQEPSKLCKWYRRRKAVRELQNDHKRDKQRLKEWEKWRQKEEEKIRDARLEQARILREQEYLQQLIEIKKEKARIARKTLQTRYPYTTPDHKAAIIKANEVYLNETKVEKRSNLKKPVICEKCVECVEPVKKQKKQKVKTGKVKKVKKEKPAKIKPLKEIITEEVEIKPNKKEKKMMKIKKAKPTVETTYMTVKRPRSTRSNRFVNCCYRICCEFYCWMTIVGLIGLTIFCFI